MKELKKLVEAGVKTPKGKSYWASDSPYSELMDKMWEDLVPSEGEAETLHGELVRSFGRLNYEFGNNGNCNALDGLTESCPQCDGSGYDENDCSNCHGNKTEEDIDGETVECSDCSGSGVEMEDCTYCDGDCTIPSGVEINKYYEVFIDFIEQSIPYKDRDVVQRFRAFLVGENKGYSDYTFDDSEMGVYNALGDSVMKVVATTENKVIHTINKN